MKQLAIAFVLLVLFIMTAPVHGGTPVQVEINGFVEFNQVNDPPLANVGIGADATISFALDTHLFVDGTMFPTRGYQIENASFEMAIDAESLGLQVPFPAGLPLEQLGIFGQFMCNFSVTYGGTTLGSLDLIDAVGTYDFTGLTVFNFTIDDGPFNAMGLVFEQMTISLFSSCPWDCGDGDGVVGINDFLELLANWGPCP